MSASLVVRAPASSANLGAGFDVFGMALELHLDVGLDVGLGPAPPGARVVDEHHPATRAFVAAGGDHDRSIWIRSSIPMGRGLGFSGAARVAGAALGAVAGDDEPVTALELGLDRVLEIAVEQEGHGDNAAASALGGAVAWVGARALPLRVGPTLAAASVVAWIPEATTSTDRSRRTLEPDVARSDAVHNLGRVAQFVLAVERDDPELLRGATDDRLHQARRLAAVPHAADALDAGVRAGAWCGWLSGSGPTVAFLCDAGRADRIAASLPANGRATTLRIARRGVHVVHEPVR